MTSSLALRLPSRAALCPAVSLLLTISDDIVGHIHTTPSAARLCLPLPASLRRHLNSFYVFSPSYTPKIFDAPDSALCLPTPHDVIVRMEWLTSNGSVLVERTRRRCRQPARQIHPARFLLESKQKWE